MKKNIRRIALVIILLSFSYISLNWYVGQQIASRSDEQTAQFSEKLAVLVTRELTHGVNLGIQLSRVGYISGLFSSTAQYDVLMMGQRISSLNVHFSHGPFFLMGKSAFKTGLVGFDVDIDVFWQEGILTGVKNIFNHQTPVKIYGYAGFDNQLHLTVEIDKIVFNQTGLMNIAFNSDPMVLKAHFPIHNKAAPATIGGDWRLPSVSFQSPFGALALTDLVFKFEANAKDMSTLQNGLYPITADISVKNMRVDYLKYVTKIDGLKINGALAVEGTNSELRYEYGFDQLIVNEAIPITFEDPALLIAHPHPNHLPYVSSSGLTYSSPRSISKSFGYRLGKNTKKVRFSQLNTDTLQAFIHVVRSVNPLKKIGTLDKIRLIAAGITAAQNSQLDVVVSSSYDRATMTFGMTLNFNQVIQMMRISDPIQLFFSVIKQGRIEFNIPDAYMRGMVRNILQLNNKNTFEASLPAINSLLDKIIEHMRLAGILIPSNENVTTAFVFDANQIKFNDNKIYHYDELQQVIVGIINLIK